MELTDKTRTQLLTYPALSHAYRVLGTEYSSLKDRQSARVTGRWAQTNSFDATACFGPAEPSSGKKFKTLERTDRVTKVLYR